MFIVPEVISEFILLDNYKTLEHSQRNARKVILDVRSENNIGLLLSKLNHFLRFGTHFGTVMLDLITTPGIMMSLLLSLY